MTAPPPDDRAVEQPERPSLSALGVLRLLGALPQGALSRGFGAAADVPLPRLLRPPVLGAFARLVGADVAEAELDLAQYPTLNQFFTRRLKAGAREWPTAQGAFGSPVDGTVGQLGTVRERRLIQAKGRSYSVGDLLDNEEEGERYEGGSFMTLYLSPRDYHRIHSPCAALIRRARHVPGALLPVNAPAVAHVPDLFARNERLICYLDGAEGRVALVAVGAYNVGRISAAFDPAWNAPPGASAWVTNRAGMRAETRSYDPPVRVAHGDEVMTFHLGSTIVLLFEPGSVRLAPDLTAGMAVRLGATIAQAS